MDLDVAKVDPPLTVLDDFRSVARASRDLRSVNANLDVDRPVFLDEIGDVIATEPQPIKHQHHRQPLAHKSGTNYSASPALCRESGTFVSRLASSASIASRMNTAIRLGPTRTSILCRTSSVSRTSVGFTFSGGLPMRRVVSDIGKFVKVPSKAISLIDRLSDIGYINDIGYGSKAMANVKHFSGTNELSGVHEKSGKLFGYVSKSDLFFVEGKGWQGYVAVERSIEFKSNPSRHECDARCVNATGRIMKCECACGGKNHGIGSFMAEAV